MQPHMTAPGQQILSIGLLTPLLLPIVSLSSPQRVQANPSDSLQSESTTKLLWLLHAQTPSEQDRQAAPSDSAPPTTPPQVRPNQQPSTESPLNDLEQPTTDPQPADQPSEVELEPEPSRKRRINYFGLGGNIGVIDDEGTATGRNRFSVVGRNSFTNNISIHSASAFGYRNIQSVALTGGVPIKNKATGKLVAFPFAGAGLAIETDDFAVYPSVTAGVDVPLNRFITGTMRVNTTFADQTDMGIVLGVGVDVFGLLFKRK